MQFEESKEIRCTKKETNIPKPNVCPPAQSIKKPVKTKKEIVFLKYANEYGDRWFFLKREMELIPYGTSESPIDMQLASWHINKDKRLKDKVIKNLAELAYWRCKKLCKNNEHIPQAKLYYDEKGILCYSLHY
jgi:hypothetical protein